MSTPARIALAALVVLLAGAAAYLFLHDRRTGAELARVTSAREEAEGRYANTIDAIAEIQDSLDAITLSDVNVKLLAQGQKDERLLQRPDGRAALDRIQVLRQSIQRNKERIRQLDTELARSGTKVRGLEKMVSNLKRDVSEKETLIAQLIGTVDTLRTQVVGLATEVKQGQDTLRVREATIEEKRTELATVYYAVGDKSTLMRAGVVVAKGGVLGLGKTLAPTGTTGASLFAPLDTDRETVVATRAAKARVLSAQAPASYELRLVDGRIQLHILDPREFRKVRTLVILTS